jgi:hypothetical protein
LEAALFVVAISTSAAVLIQRRRLQLLLSPVPRRVSRDHVRYAGVFDVIMISVGLTTCSARKQAPLADAAARDLADQGLGRTRASRRRRRPAATGGSATFPATAVEGSRYQHSGHDRNGEESHCVS